MTTRNAVDQAAEASVFEPIEGLPPQGGGPRAVSLGLVFPPARLRLVARRLFRRAAKKSTAPGGDDDVRGRQRARCRQGRHRRGDCSAADGTSAGGHYNPDGNPHGRPDSPLRHAGDPGNVTADAQGVVTAEFLDSVITLNGANSIIGRGVIVHEGPDDFTTQPTGAAGARQSCGVIGDRRQAVRGRSRRRSWPCSETRQSPGNGRAA